MPHRRLRPPRKRGPFPGVRTLDASARSGAWTTMSTAWTAPQTSISRARRTPRSSRPARRVTPTRSARCTSAGSARARSRVPPHARRAGGRRRGAGRVPRRVAGARRPPGSRRVRRLAVAHHPQPGVQPGAHDVTRDTGGHRDDGDDRAHAGGRPRRRARRTRPTRRRRRTGRAGVGVGRRARASATPRCSTSRCVTA